MRIGGNRIGGSKMLGKYSVKIFINLYSTIISMANSNNKPNMSFIGIVLYS
jgi:hypothetical protein